MSKYTKSSDGIYRMNLWFSVRVGKDELLELNQMAKKCGLKNFREYVDSQMFNIKSNLIDEVDEIENGVEHYG